MTQVSAPTSSTNSLAAAVVERYGNAAKFLSTFPPQNQIKFSSDLARLFRGAAPAIALVAKAYGMATAESWLEIQLHDLNEYVGCKTKQDILQKEQTARVIISEYGYLKVTELMYFFLLLKAGRFGKFYGVVDAMDITTALNRFLDLRDKELDKIIRAEKKAQRERYLAEQAKDAISYEEYQKLRGLSNMGYERK